MLFKYFWLQLSHLVCRDGTLKIGRQTMVTNLHAAFSLSKMYMNFYTRNIFTVPK